MNPEYGKTKRFQNMVKQKKIIGRKELLSNSF